MCVMGFRSRDFAGIFLFHVYIDELVAQDHIDYKARFPEPENQFVKTKHVDSKQMEDVWNQNIF